MFDPQAVIVGNLVADPQLTFTSNGYARASFRIAATQRRLDRATGEWRDGDSFYAGVTCWRGLAENVCASLHRGQGAVVVGRISLRRYETRDGTQRESVEIDATAIGADLTRAIAMMKRAERGVPVSFPAAPDGTHEAGLDTASAGDRQAGDAGTTPPGGTSEAEPGAGAGDDLHGLDGRGDGVDGELGGLMDGELADPANIEAGDDADVPDGEPVGAGDGARRKGRFGLG